MAVTSFPLKKVVPDFWTQRYIVCLSCELSCDFYCNWMVSHEAKQKQDKFRNKVHLMKKKKDCFCLQFHGGTKTLKT